MTTSGDYLQKKRDLEEILEDYKDAAYNGYVKARKRSLEEWILDQLAELDEAQSEIKRHHSDFGHISALCEEALSEEALTPEGAIHAIRRIVG